MKKILLPILGLLVSCSKSELSLSKKWTQALIEERLQAFQVL